jgi:cytochrome c-type biogenesis protein
MLEQLTTSLYYLEQVSDHLVANQLSHLTPVSLGIIFGAGLLTSLTPCTLSMLPITMGYIGGYAAGDAAEGQSATRSGWRAAIQSTWFALGLATTLTAFGIGAALLGRIYGQIGSGLAIVVSLIAILMGLNLLEALPLRFPSFNSSDQFLNKLPTGLRAYGFGLTFGLVASPCSTPVLATLLAWVSTTQDPILGSCLLLAYTAGFTAPLIIAGTFTVAIKQFLSLRRWSSWITPASGILLIGFGVFSLLTRFLPALPTA